MANPAQLVRPRVIAKRVAARLRGQTVIIDADGTICPGTIHESVRVSVIEACPFDPADPVTDDRLWFRRYLALSDAPAPDAYQWRTYDFLSGTLPHEQFVALVRSLTADIVDQILNSDERYSDIRALSAYNDEHRLELMTRARTPSPEFEASEADPSAA